MTYRSRIGQAPVWGGGTATWSTQQQRATTTPGWTGATAPTTQPAPTYTAGPDTSGNTMYASGWATTPTTTAATSAPPAFDWRQGAWQVANRWAPQWAAANPWTSITDPKAVVTALSAYTPDKNSGAWGQYNTDIKYLTAGQGNTAMPSWYGIQQPWNQVTSPTTNVPGVNYTPQYAPTFDWSQWGGQTATNPVQTYAGTPAWMNDPSWITNPALASQAEKWAAIMVPWAQTQQNAYQYANDANEAQRRYNLDAAWRQAQDQFTMDQAAKTAEYQKVRDAEEFALGRQQIWGRNQTPNVRWQRNWG